MKKTGIEYRLVADYYLPNMSIPKARRIRKIEKYGRMKLRYMKEFKKVEYSKMLINNELSSYLLDIEDECNLKIENLIKELAKKENITEELKDSNQMEWVQKMNNIKARTEGIIYNEIIYK